MFCFSRKDGPSQWAVSPEMSWLVSPIGPGVGLAPTGPDGLTVGRCRRCKTRDCREAD